MSISIDQSAAFLAVAQSGSIRDAAKRLGKAPSTVSNLVNYLEIELDQELFVRHPRSVELTESGRELIEYATSLISEAELLKAKAQSILSGVPSRLKVAIDASLWCDDIAKCFKDLSEAFPPLNIDVQMGDAIHVQKLVLANEADIGLRISAIDFPPALAHARSFNFKLAMVASPDHPLCQGMANREMLSRHRQILYRPMSVGGLDELQKLGHHCIKVSTAIEIRDLAVAGLGWAVLPAFQLGVTIKSGQLQELKFPHGTLRDDWRSDIIWRENRIMDPAIKYMIRSLASLVDR